jgi:hypothetical protein
VFQLRRGDRLLSLEVLIKPAGSLRYAFNAGELDRDHEPGARDANGDDSGMNPAKARIFH